jgi:hypothetical protein
MAHSHSVWIARAQVPSPASKAGLQLRQHGGHYLGCWLKQFGVNVTIVQTELKDSSGTRSDGTVLLFRGFWSSPLSSPFRQFG